MQLWTLAIKMPHKIGTNVVANWVVLDICHTLVTNTWSKWTRFFYWMRSYILPKVLKYCCNKSFMMQLRLKGGKNLSNLLWFFICTFMAPLDRIYNNAKVVHAIECFQQSHSKHWSNGGKLGDGRLYMQTNFERNLKCCGWKQVCFFKCEWSDY